MTNKPGQSQLRRTKIIATLGPATDDESVLVDMVNNGLDVVRINFSHGSEQEHIQRVERVRQVSQKCGRYVGILMDLQGPKIRIGKFADGKISLSQGDAFVLDTKLDLSAGDQQRVGVTYPQLADDVKAGDCLLLDDGLVELRV